MAIRGPNDEGQSTNSNIKIIKTVDFLIGIWFKPDRLTVED